MNLPALAHRFRWLNMPSGLLIMLLQRAPAPMLRVLVQLESLVVDGAPVILRSGIALAAMGTYNSVAGATVFNVTATPTAASPTSGAAKVVFAVSEASGAAVSVGISVSGAPGNPKSYSVSGTLPTGLSITNGTGSYVNVSAPYKMTIAGTPTAAGSFPVTVTAWDGTNGSGGNSAKISVNFTITGGVTAVAPSITTQPNSVTVTAGSPASFTVAASGSPAPTFQWQKGGVNITGAMSATYSIASAVAGDAGSYAAVVTNSAGTVTSSAATLTVNAATSAPTITTQPASQMVTAGASVSFTVAASGSPAPTFQWQKGGVIIAGATSATYSITSAVAGDAGSYTTVASNPVGSATSSAATLTVQAAPPANTAPTITTQPTSQTVTAGGSVSFTVAASGNPAPTYQWQKGGANIAGATSATYSIASTVTGDAGSYTAVATNTAGSATSTAATLTVTASATAGPAITIPLAAQTVTTGHSLSFSAQALSGTYQWQVSSDNGATWANLANNSTYSGVTSPKLTVTGATAAMGGFLYRYVVTDTSGSTASNSATLTVTGAFLPFPTGIILVGTIGLYLTDSAANTVQLVTTTGDVTLVAGTTGTAGTLDGIESSALFNQPGGLVATSAGVIYVADTANATIRRIGTDGSVTTIAGSTVARGNADGPGSQATFSAPLGLALDTAGNLYVADSTNHTIRKITSLGTVSTLAGSAGLTGSANGTGPDARFNFPAGVAVDPAGNVFVADRTNNLIRRITPAGAVTTFAGTPGVSGADDGTGSAALFNQPTGLILDAAGNLYVADTGNCTIRKITGAGVVSTLAGLPTVGGDQDGTGLGALFNQPRALTIDNAGNLYVADTGNSSIRQVTPAGVVTTLNLRQGITSPAIGSSGSTGGNTGTTSTPVGSGTSPASSSGGGGALSDWFLGSLGALCLIRGWQRHSRRHRTGNLFWSL